MRQGLTYLFTGDGKGKTSAALGLALRAVCADKKVAWISWYKNSDWDISEKKMPELLNIDYYLMGVGFYIKEVIDDKRKVKSENKNTNSKLKNLDKKSQIDHQQAAKLALKKAEEILKRQRHFLLICDEIINCLKDELLTFSQIKNLIAQRGKTHLVLTGRNASLKLINLVDLATEMKKLKHPYDSGTSAVKGLDF
jgi:cob(I)alamin adenosyltransferase